MKACRQDWDLSLILASFRQTCDFSFLISSAVNSSAGVMTEDVDKMFDESLWEAVPEQYRGFSLQNLMEANRTEVERFRAYIQVN